MVNRLERHTTRQPRSHGRGVCRTVVRWLLVATVAALTLDSSPPGTGQTVGSGGISQHLRITDDVDLRAFRNVLVHARPHLLAGLSNGVPITSLEFLGVSASGGSRLYSGHLTSQAPSTGPLIDRLEFVYRYIGTTGLPTIPPDRVKYYLNAAWPTFPPPSPIIPGLATFDFVTAVLGNPPIEVLSFLNGRDLVALTASAPPPGSQEMTVEFRYEGGAQQLPVRVIVVGSCPGGVCAWTVTVQ